MNARKVLLIVNPASGTLSKHRVVPQVLKELKRHGFEVETVGTRGPGHATELSAEAARKGGYYAVLACGGDGTVNEVASGLIGTSTPMAIIPCGSGNGLARHLEIPVDIRRSVDVLAAGNVIDADYGTANGKPFFCTFGVGFDAAVSERFARQKRRGLIMYLKSAIDEFVNFSPENYIIEVNGKTISDRAFLIVVCNASQYGNNAFIAPYASVTDGELDVTVVHNRNLIETAVLGVDFITGYIGDNAMVDTFKAKSVRITRAAKGAAHFDGDPVVVPPVIDIECHAAQLKLFAPTDHTRFRPILTPITLFLRDAALRISQIFSFK